MKKQETFDKEDDAIEWVWHLSACFLIRKVTINRIFKRETRYKPARYAWRVTATYD